MNIPKIDSMGKVIFPQDKQITKSEFEGFFIPAQEKTDVGNNASPTDNHDIDSELESEQTADLAEDARKRAEKLWNDGWQAGHRAGYRDALEDQQEKNNGNH